MTTNTTQQQITISDLQGGLHQQLELDLAHITPQQVVEHLLSEQQLMRTAPDGTPLHYTLARGTTKLVPDVALAQQGVEPGDSLTLFTLNTKGGSR